MPIEVWSVVLGTVLGTVLTSTFAFWMHRQQREDADRDWHRSNQRDIDWQAQDFVIEVQAFSNDPNIRGPVQVFDSTMDMLHFNHAKAIELIARANAFEARVKDPELRHHIQSLNTELLIASHRNEFGRDNRFTVHAHCQKFYYRIAKLYGGRLAKTTEDQFPKLEYRAAPGPVVVEGGNLRADARETSPETSP